MGLFGCLICKICGIYVTYTNKKKPPIFADGRLEQSIKSNTMEFITYDHEKKEKEAVSTRCRWLIPD